MITESQARALVESLVCTKPEWLPDDDELIIVDDATITKPWGWVFFYASKKWMETRDIRYAIAGNAPLIVEKNSGNVIPTGTAYSTKKYIENYELTGDPHSF